MFEDKRITKDKVKDIIYAVLNEFENELDLDYEFIDRTITNEDLDMISDGVKKFVNKLELVINDELE